MILADKIINLRKKAGWSQDELASKLNVTRQSVSKWEGAQSIPDMERIVQMSRLFGVTTDYLLKDELETEEFSSARCRRRHLAARREHGTGVKLSGAAQGSRAEDSPCNAFVHRFADRHDRACLRK